MDKKRDFGRNEVRLRLLDDAPQGFKGLAVPIHNGADARVDEHANEVLEPGCPHTFVGAVEPAREAFSRFVDGERLAGTGAHEASPSMGN